MKRPDFGLAVETVLEHEGGFVDDPKDTGGATNWGISLRFLRELEDADGDGYRDGDLDRDGDVDAADIRRMTRAQAVELYRRHFWEPGGYVRLGSSLIATKLFDLAVNMGPRPAHRLAQQGLRAVGYQVTPDGFLGPKTVARILEAPPLELAAAIRSEAAGFYRVLIALKPVREKYRDGWLRRAYF